MASGCTQVKIKDQVAYGDKGKFGALEFHTLTDAKRDVPKEEWDKMRFGMICTSAENWADTLANVEKFCLDNPMMCTVEAKRLIRRTKKNVNTYQRSLAP